VTRTCVGSGEGTLVVLGLLHEPLQHVAPVHLGLEYLVDESGHVGAQFTHHLGSLRRLGHLDLPLGSLLSLLSLATLAVLKVVACAADTVAVTVTIGVWQQAVDTIARTTAVGVDGLVETATSMNLPMPSSTSSWLMT